MAEDATELDLCFVRFNAAKAALERATAQRKQLLTRHGSSWYEAVKEEAECFNATYEALQAVQALLSVPEGHAVEHAGSPSWYLRTLAPSETAAAPTATPAAAPAWFSFSSADDVRRGE
ncbi:MAG: hypothetical protein H0V12_12000 [Chloroflexi bacterium]|nr:hypothetical protein [Chloroflexota bacterium]